MSKQLQIRNSTAEFLIFQAEDKAQGVQVFYQDENIWATQKAMSELYGIDKSGISRHLANIYESGELRPEMTVAKFATVVNRGIRGEVTEEIDFYNLDVKIAMQKSHDKLDKVDQVNEKLVKMVNLVMQNFKSDGIRHNGHRKNAWHKWLYWHYEAGKCQSVKSARANFYKKKLNREER